MSVQSSGSTLRGPGAREHARNEAWWRAPLSFDVAVFGAFVVLIVIANRIGFALLADGYRTRILAPPLIGSFDPVGLWRAGLLVGSGVLAAKVANRVGHLRSWPRVVGSATVATAVWAMVLAVVRGGWSEIGRPMALPGHYLEGVGAVGTPGGFVDGFVANIDQYGTHVRAHPPGFVLLLWLTDRIGLGGAQWAGLLVIAGGSVAVAAVLFTTRLVAGEFVARRAAPWCVVMPGVLFIASTADAFFAGVAATAVALFVNATDRRTPGARKDGRGGVGRRSGWIVSAIGSGWLFGGALMLSYGLALIAFPVFVLVIVRRAYAVAGVVAVSALSVLGGFWVAGFSWLDGLGATRREYAESVAQERPYGWFLVLNLAAFALVCGPATLAGLVQLCRTRIVGLGLVIGVGLLSAAVALGSGLSKGEVERIWLPFAIWLAPAGAMLTFDGPTVRARVWIALQCATAVTVQLLVRTNW